MQRERVVTQSLQQGRVATAPRGNAARWLIVVTAVASMACSSAKRNPNLPPPEFEPPMPIPEESVGAPAATPTKVSPSASEAVPSASTDPSSEPAPSGTIAPGSNSADAAPSVAASKEGDKGDAAEPPRATAP